MRRLAPATCDNGWGFCLILPSFQQLQQLGGYWLRCARLQSGRLPNRDFLIYRFVGCGWADGAKWIMPLAHPGLQSSRTPLVPRHRQRKFSAPWSVSESFHIISYLVDVYRGNQPAQQSPLAFALYIVNFPQLIAGPIIRYSQIADQLVKRRATLDDMMPG